MPTSPRLETPVPPSPLVMKRPAHVVFGLPAIPRRTAPITRRIWRERLLWTSRESGITTHVLHVDRLASDT
jgi:hypothetical protein